MITYNHERFIAQAIESALMQQTDFSFEIVIGEDCSQDRTRKIVSEYQRRYPDAIRLLLPQRNRGMQRNFADTFDACQGQYIALLEGDDYWIDPLKLQKQACFLDAAAEYSMCFHWAFCFDQATGEIGSAKWGPLSVKTCYTTEDLLEHSNFVSTASAVFRRGIFSALPTWFMTVPFNDFPLHILNSQYGKIGFLNEVMAVYRQHAGGVYSGNSALGNNLALIKTYQIIGAELLLTEGISYRIGLSQRRAELCHAFRQEGRIGQALLAGLQAVRTAPRKHKRAISVQVIRSLVPLVSDIYRCTRRMWLRQCCFASKPPLG